VHLIRNSLSFCNWKQRQPVVRELKQIYEAETAELAAKRLEDFARVPGVKSCRQSSRAGAGSGSK
jgi:transposase-like protein